jgi:hypothetical protein
MMEQHRHLIKRAALAVLAGLAASMEASASDWGAGALDLQEHLDNGRPLSQSFWVGAHNAYNAYNWDGSYRLDPNQTLSPTEQLDAGVRMMSFDVHPLNTWSDKMYLCHAAEVGGISWGCSSSNERFKEGLKAVRNWINDGHGDSVVMIKLETESNLGQSAADIEDYIGSMVYKPANAGLSGCASLPVATITKQDVLDAGKNVILISTPSKCGDMKRNSYRQWVFIGLDVYDAANGQTVANQKFEKPGSVSACEGYGASYRQANMLRQFDGTTFEGTYGGGSPKLTAANIGGFMACGLNIAELFNVAGESTLSLDGGTHTTQYAFLDNDNLVWSWGTNEPNSASGDEDCAESRADGRFNDAQCGLAKRVACRAASGNWQVTVGAYFFSNGAYACDSEFGGAYAFDKPATAFENGLLIAAKATAGAGDVWINYTDQSNEGAWE